MTAVLVALSAMAAPKSMKMSANADAFKMVSSSQMVDFKSADEKAPMKSWTDNNGVTWDAYLLRANNLWEMVGDGTLTVADFPAYWVQLNLSAVNSAGTGYEYNYMLDLAYPAAIAFFYDSTTDSYSYEAALEALGDEKLVYAPAPLEWFEQTDDFKFSMIEEGYVNTFGILHPGTTGTTCIYKGEQGYTFDETTTVMLGNYDSELSWLDINVNGKVVSNMTRTVNLPYSGETSILGISNTTNTFTIGEVHVFDCGDIDYDSDFGLCYLFEFEPVRRYWTVLTSDKFTFVDFYNGGTGLPANNCFSATELPTQGPGIALTDDMNVTWLQGAFFAPAGSTQPYGQWVMDHDWIGTTIQDIENTPEPWQLMQGGYNIGISEEDGTFLVHRQFYRNPTVGNTEIVIGDKDYGMKLQWLDKFGDGWDLSYTGDIYFHNNPADYTQFTTIPAVGTESLFENLVPLDSSVEGIVMPENEKINVKVVGNSIVAPEGAEVYNLNGVRVNAENLANGLYIVKVGKNAVKVVL